MSVLAFIYFRLIRSEGLPVNGEWILHARGLDAGTINLKLTSGKTV